MQQLREQEATEIKVSEEKVVNMETEQETRTVEEQMTIPHLKNRLVKLPEEKKEFASKLYAYTQQRDKMAMEKKSIELATFTEVTNEKTPEGKNVFSNDKVRESETAKRLKLNTAYQNLLEREDKILFDTHMAKIELDYFKDSLKAIGILVELIKLE